MLTLLGWILLKFEVFWFESWTTLTPSFALLKLWESVWQSFVVSTLGLNSLFNVNQRLTLSSCCTGVFIRADYNIFLSSDGSLHTGLARCRNRSEGWLAGFVPADLSFKRSRIVVVKLIVRVKYWQCIWLISSETCVIFSRYFCVYFYGATSCWCVCVLSHDLYSLEDLWAFGNFCIVLASLVQCQALFVSELNFHI